MNAGSSPPAPQRHARRAWLLGGAVLAAALLVVLALWFAGAQGPGSGQPAAPAAPTSSMPDTPAASPAPPLTPAPTVTAEAGQPHPSDCQELYSPAIVEAFGDKVLNPGWTLAPDSGVRHGSNDPELVAVIDAAEHLSCVWGSEAGGSDSGLSTNLVWVSAEQNALVQGRLVALGMSCYDELGGVRCVRSTTEGTDTFGESHFLREGIWIATQYANAGPDGYTQDMIANVWDGA